MPSKDRYAHVQISAREVLGVLAFYVFFSFLYHAVLQQNGLSEGQHIWDTLFSWRSYWFASGMQYGFYLLASMLIWFLGIYLLKNYSSLVQIIAVALMIPAVVYLVREGRYEIIDYLGQNRLRGKGVVWDWYIPFLFMTIQFGCFFAYRYFKDNQRKLRIEGELKSAALRSELSALKAQLNPHFLYNVFNTISASVPAEQEKTRHLIAELSDLFRYQLKASQVDRVPLREELDFVEKYLALEKERFGERLTVTINVSAELKDEMVPPMLLQPIVENSIKHGLASLIEGGKISISIVRKREKLYFEIADTGVGIKDKMAAFDTGIGLTNTRLRLEKMYQSSMELSDNEPKGLKISFAL